MTFAEKSGSSINWVRGYIDLLDVLNIGFLLVDMDDNCLEVNETLLEMTGYTRERVIGCHVSDFYGLEEYERLKRIEVPLQKNTHYQFEYYIAHNDRSRIPALLSISTNLDVQGRPESQNVMITDIREQKKIQAELVEANQALIASRDTLEREKKKLETILFGIGECVTIFDQKGRLILCNPKGQDLRRRRQTPFLSLEPGNQGQLTLKKGSETRYFFGHVQAIFDQQGAVYAYVETLKDITDQIRLEEREQELHQMKHLMKRTQLKTDLIGVSQAINAVFDLILRCCEVDSTVIILGETGVGKELAAKTIHENSPRESGPFLAVNCGALPDALLESELFGHVKGAFTGAVNDNQGLFRAAGGGTIFLDEVGDLSLPLQVKLLRALQEKEIRPVGSSKTYPIDIRVICATNRNLKELVKNQRFRQDLYYRLAVIQLMIPPLKERKADILPLAEHFLSKHRSKKDQSPKTLDQSAQQSLLDYLWPGNVRELENCIEYALAMAADQVISLKDLPLPATAEGKPNDANLYLQSNGNPSLDSGLHYGITDNKKIMSKLTTQLVEAEKEAISSALHHNKGNRTLAARELGISRTTLWRKITMYHLNQ